MVHDLTTQKGREAYAIAMAKPRANNQRNPNDVFTVQDGIDVQTKQLEQWAKVLKPEIHESLVIHATAKNHLAVDGYQIARGGKLDVMVSWMASGHLEILKKPKQ